MRSRSSTKFFWEASGDISAEEAAEPSLPELTLARPFREGRRSVIFLRRARPPEKEGREERVGVAAPSRASGEMSPLSGSSTSAAVPFTTVWACAVWDGSRASNASSASDGIRLRSLESGVGVEQVAGHVTITASGSSPGASVASPLGEEDWGVETSSVLLSNCGYKGWVVKRRGQGEGDDDAQLSF